jgi:hypothetical protein
MCRRCRSEDKSVGMTNTHKGYYYRENYGIRSYMRCLPCFQKSEFKQTAPVRVYANFQSCSVGRDGEMIINFK